MNIKWLIIGFLSYVVAQSAYKILIHVQSLLDIYFLDILVERSKHLIARKLGLSRGSVWWLGSSLSKIIIGTRICSVCPVCASILPIMYPAIVKRGEKPVVPKRTPIEDEYVDF